MRPPDRPPKFRGGAQAPTTPGDKATEASARMCRCGALRITDDEPMDAAGAVDAKDAPTAPWKTTNRFSTSAHRRPSQASKGDISIELTRGTFLTSFDSHSGVA